MKKRLPFIIVAIGLTMLLASGWSLWRDKTLAAQKDESASPLANSSQSHPTQSSAPPSAAASTPAASPASAAAAALAGLNSGSSSGTTTSAAGANSARPTSDVESLHAMVKALFQFSRPKAQLSELVAFLKSTQQDPILFRDTNSFTGSMTIVHTRNPFLGTRYFHAQYFGDDQQASELQHMSFEYRPGPNSLSDAIQTVETSFPKLGKRVTRLAGRFAEWDAGDCNTVWLKQLDAKDVKNSHDPFKPRTGAQDVGTVVIAFEKNPDCGE